MRNVVQLCLAANNILPYAWTKPRVIRYCVKKGRSLRFPKIFIKKQTWWSNDKAIIELGYHNIWWFASVSHINYLPQPSASATNWSARRWQITMFFSLFVSYKYCYLLNYNILLNLTIQKWFYLTRVQYLLDQYALLYTNYLVFFCVLVAIWN